MSGHVFIVVNDGGVRQIEDAAVPFAVPSEGASVLDGAVSSGQRRQNIEISVSVKIAGDGVG